jgi:hypothetical protein
MIAVLSLFAVYAADKVTLEEPNQKNLVDEFKNMPDGVLNVKTNPDGSFRSLIVKATVEIEDVLGGQKGRRLAQKEAEVQCKKLLSQWMNECCAFAETSTKSTTIITKGESAKDAAGNTVRIRNQQGQETKTLTEIHAAASAAVLRGMIVLSSEVTAGNHPEFILVMGLSQKNIDQARLTSAALSGQSSAPHSVSSGGSGESDLPAAEKKENPAAQEFR